MLNFLADIVLKNQHDLGSAIVIVVGLGLICLIGWARGENV